MMKSVYGKFRFWLLLVYATVGALLWSFYIAFFASIPPDREYLGEYGFRYAWTLIVFTGAFTGGFCYVISYLMYRKFK